MTSDPAAIQRHYEALRRVVVEHPEMTVQQAYAAAQEAVRAPAPEPTTEPPEKPFSEIIAECAERWTDAWAERLWGRKP
jgi:hypothetical protein